MKEHLKFALKVAVALVIVNALIDVAKYFGFGIVEQVVYAPLKLVGFNKESAS